MRQLAFALALLIPLRAVADPKTEAKQHIDRATKAHSAGDYATALDEMNVAYTLDPQPSLLYAIGQIHVKLGQCEEAITFYERFLATHPARSAGDRASQAISVCKERLAHPEPVVEKPVVEKPVVEKPVEAPPPPPPPQPLSPAPPLPQRDTASPFYADPLGDALVIGGVALGVIAGLEYRSALHDIDLANSAATYDLHAEFVSHAESKRTYVSLFGGGGLVLIGLGVFRYLHHGGRDDQGVAIGPTRDGAVMTWSSRF